MANEQVLLKFFLHNIGLFILIFLSYFFFFQKAKNSGSVDINTKLVRYRLNLGEKFSFFFTVLQILSFGHFFIFDYNIYTF